MLLIVDIASRSNAINKDYVEIIEALRYRDMYIHIVSDDQRLTLNSYNDHRETRDE